MNHLTPKHPRAIRWMHWINVPLLVIMIWSGLLIYWANDVYAVHLGGFTLFHFFPDWFYQALGLEHGLAVGMAYHFAFAWFFALNGTMYVLYTFVSGEWRHLLPNRHTPRAAWHVVLHDLRLRKTPPPPAKFNGAQRLAYTGVILMGAGSLLTGLAIYKPTQLAWLTTLLGGYEWARWEHFTLMVGYVLFFLIHISQVIRAGWNNFRAMVTGYELVPAEESPMPDPKATSALTGPMAEREMRRLTRRSFAVGTVAALAGFGAWRWLKTATPEDGLPWPLRRMLRFNQGLAESLYSPGRLAPTFPADTVQGAARTNGLVGLASEVNAATWQLRIQHVGRGAEQVLGLPALRGLPRTDLVTELKCVEGWSEVMHFGGVRFFDFLTRFRLGTRSGGAPDPAGNPQDLYRYVYLATPDEGYYVGLDMASALHPQTLLCDTMNGQPLTREHGAPLRLYLTVKYGYKSHKRIGLIRFQDERPPDYWAERGYDWYAGH